MNYILKKLAYYIRGFLYLIFYHIPYKIFLKKDALESEIVSIRVDDYSYKMRLQTAEGGLSEDLHICAIREVPNVHYFADFVTSHAKDLQTYIDIGSNIGYYLFLSQQILRKVNTQAKIFAVEPVKSTFSRMLENMKLNNVNDVVPINIGIGDANGMAKMLVMHQKNLSKILDENPILNGDLEKVEQVKLNSLSSLFTEYSIKPENYFIRCEIEGYEYNLIVGNKDLLQRSTNAHIVMEFHPFYLLAIKSVELLNTLKSVGFTLHQVISCEPLYFVKTPVFVRAFLKKLFLYQYNGDVLGKLERFKTIDDLIAEIQNTSSPLYHYPNLHFYFSKK